MHKTVSSRPKATVLASNPYLDLPASERACEEAGKERPKEKETERKIYTFS